MSTQKCVVVNDARSVYKNVDVPSDEDVSGVRQSLK